MVVQRGFTLMELMIVLGIVAILGMIALPAYQDYLVRTKVIEGLNLATAAQLLVAENATDGEALNAHFIPPSATAYVAGIAVDAAGVITITYTPAAGNGTLLLTPSYGAGLALVPGVIPNDTIKWFCAAAGKVALAPYRGAAGTLLARYAPAGCR